MAAALLAGCAGPAYVARLGWEEARILLRRRPIDGLLARPDLDPALRERLELALAARVFARDRLGLDVGDSYTTFAEVDERAVVHVLSAARRDRLALHTWWYPIAGRVPYRGFFDPAAARAAGEQLGREGFDVDVRPAVAFSTLGWFADPLLSTTARHGPVDVVETVIHELFHATLWVPNAVAFNESAATFVGHRGAIAFFCGGPGDDAGRCDEARAAWASTQAQGRILGRLVRRLQALFAEPLDPATLEARRVRASAAAARALVRHRAGAAGELLPPNNARLMARVLYLTDLETFEALAPGDVDPAPAIELVVARADGATDPFRAVRAAAAGRFSAVQPAAGPATVATCRLRGHRRRAPRVSPSTRCWDGLLAGSASSGTTWRTARI